MAERPPISLKLHDSTRERLRVRLQGKHQSIPAHRRQHMHRWQPALLHMRRQIT